MNVLITGGAGYKGLILAQKLLENNHNVTVIDNFMYGVELSLYLFSYPHISFIRKDIRNIDKSDLSNFDCIYHLAAISGYPACETNPHSAIMINIKATERMISMMSTDQLLIYASTTSVYGQMEHICDEDSKVNPASLYAKSKLEAEVLCLQRENSISLRFATLFGVAPRMRWDLLLNNFVMKAVQERSLILFEPNSRRTFLHISDAINAYVMALDNSDSMVGNIFNVGSEEMNYSKKEIAEMIKEKVDYEIIISKLEDLDVRNFYVKFDKIKSIGFRPKVSIADGIAELVKLFSYYKPIESFKVI